LVSARTCIGGGSNADRRAFATGLISAGNHIEVLVVKGGEGSTGIWPTNNRSGMTFLGIVPTAMSVGRFGTIIFKYLVSTSFGAEVYLVLLSLMVPGSGLLCRNSAGAIVAAIMLVTGVPQALH
jgi:hypothetical protein